ncbi:MAG: sigma-70 family RNA polymerase sigma factor [Chthoniobacterales bacterium]|nr:sigma-70 family RNA polymerase sigma factor [Chthoniobacterales bacterium]
MQQEGEPTDQELIEKTLGGEPEAFEELVRRYTNRLYGLIYNMTANHEDTADLIQEVFTKAYHSLKGFRGDSSFSTWLHTIAVNKTINYLKWRGRRQHISLSELDSGAGSDSDLKSLVGGDDPSRQAYLKELQRRLNEAMLKLSPNHRAVVAMFDIQGMPHSEIAKVLGISEGTVRSRLFYAHRELQTYLRGFEP